MSVGMTVALLLAGAGRPEILAHYTFEPGEEVKWGGMGKHAGWYSLITTDPSEVISGRGSLKCDTTNSSGTWHGFFCTIPKHLRLRRNTAYFIRFKYRVLARQEGARFVVFLRSPTARVFTDRGWISWAEKPGPPREITMFVLVGNSDDYQIHVQIYGRGAMVLDDFTVWGEKVEGARLQPPRLMYPRDGVSLSPEALQFVWTLSPPAVEYEVQFSRTSDFSRPVSFLVKVPMGTRFCYWAFTWQGKKVRTNVPHLVTFFAPQSLPEGRWHWRVRPKGGRWSRVSSFTLHRSARQKGLSLNISPLSPLLILYWHHNPPAGSISTCWNAVPTHIRRFTAFRVWTGGRELRTDFFDLLDEIERAKVRAFLQVEHENIWKLPLSLVEEVFQRYSHVVGVYIVEYWNSQAPPQWWDMKRAYLARLAALCARYGRLMVYSDGHGNSHTFLEMGNDEMLFQAFRKYRRNVILSWKQNSPKVSFLVHSAVVGLWLSGACRDWGVGMEHWYWWEAGFGKLNEATGHSGGMPPQNMPKCFLNIMALLGACTGATVYQLEAGGSWGKPGHPFDKGKPTEWVRDVLFPLFERMVKWGLIPSKDEVITSMPIAYKACPQDAEWVRDAEGFRVNARLRALFDAAYKWHYFNEMIPNVAGRQIVPVLPSLASPKDVPRFRVLLSPSDITSKEDVERALRRAYEGIERPRGSAFCVKVGRRLFACNPYENWDKPSWFEAPLEGPFVRLRAEMPVNSSLVGKEEGEKLMLHLNGRDGRETHLEVVARGKIRVEANPPDLLVKKELLSEGRRARLVVLHKGWCDVVISVGK